MTGARRFSRVRRFHEFNLDDHVPDNHPLRLPPTGPNASAGERCREQRSCGPRCPDCEGLRASPGHTPRWYRPTSRPRPARGNGASREPPDTTTASHSRSRSCHLGGSDWQTTAWDRSKRKDPRRKGQVTCHVSRKTCVNRQFAHMDPFFPHMFRFSSDHESLGHPVVFLPDRYRPDSPRHLVGRRHGSGHARFACRHGFGPAIFHAVSAGRPFHQT